MTTTKKTTTRTRKSTTKPTVNKTATRKITPTAKITLTPKSFVHEIFAAVSSERTKVKKLEILRNYNENFIKSILIWNFDETIISILPEGEVPITHKEDAEKNPETSIRREWSKFFNFVKGGNDAMNRLKKETMFINILEQLHPGESEIICLVKDKKLSDKYNITKDLVSEAYPDIKWGGRS